MGKTRNKKRGHSNRQNPVGIPSVRELIQHEEEEVMEDGGNSTFIQTVLDQIKSHTVEERDSGLNSLASSCSNKVLLDELLKQHDLIKTIGPLMLDKSIIIRHSATGALRNISSTDGEVCDFMVSQGIMVHLVQLFKQYFAGDWEPHKHGSKTTEEATASKFEKIDTLTDTFIQATNLLWNLCENSEVALKFFNRSNLGPIISKCLNVDRYGFSLAISAAQCINAVTESITINSAGLGEIDELLQKILTTESTSSEGFNNLIYLQTLCAGILLNLKRGEVLKLPTPHLALLLKILSSALSSDHIAQLKRFSSEIPIDTRSEGMDTEHGHIHSNADVDPKLLQTLEHSSEEITNLLNAQLMALETLANILFVDEEDAEATDDEDDSGESIPECMDEESAQDCDKQSSPSGVISEVFEGVIAHDLVEKSLVKAYYPPVNVMQILSESAFSSSMPEILIQLRCRSLICYQNLVAGLDLKDLGGFTQTKVTWDFLGQLLVEASADTSGKSSLMDQVEATTSAMRALVQKWVDENCSDLLESLSPDVFKGFCNIYQNIDVAKIQANVIKIIGGLGTLIVRKKGVTEGAEILLFQVGEFLLDCASKNPDRQHLWRTAEALDTLFDVFSEDDYNEVLNQLKMVERLKLFLPQFKKVIKLQRRELGENKAVIDTARLNLSRFIEYKMKHGCH